MAIETAVDVFQGTDRQFVFTIKNAAETACVDITGWALSWMVKRYPADTDLQAIVTKTVALGGIVISGVFNATPSVNTQVATVTLVDTDTTLVDPGLYRYELKRTDDNLETVLSYGPLVVIQGVHR